MSKILRRIHFLLKRRQAERDLADEMAAHRQMMADDRRGSFGRELALREEAREAWGWIWLDRLWQDLVYATRTFRRSPGFTLGAITILALGMGVNLAEFHVFDAAFLHRLNLPGSDTIFHFVRSSKNPDAPTFPLAAIEFLRRNCSQCAFVVAERGGVRVVLESEADTRANFVSGNYFTSLNLLPAWGRLPDERDAQPDAPAVAVLGYEYWRDSLGADPHVIDRIMHVNGKPVQIVGVVPFDFDGLQPHSTDLWVPVSQRALLIPGTPPPESFARPDEDLYARPKPGVSLASLEAELTGLIGQLAHREPLYFKGDERVLGERLGGSGVPPPHLKAPVFLLFGLVMLVLFSACANLGNLMLARGFARQREIEIRIELGAGRARVIRQLLTENLLLSFMGAGAALGGGYASARLLLNALGAPPSVRVSMHWQVLAGAGFLTVLSAMAFGLPSALQIAGARHKASRRRTLLVGIQVAISSLLLICSGVLTRNAIRAADIRLCFDYRNMIAVYPGLAGQNLPPAVAAQKLDLLMTAVSRIPGADGVTAAVMPPLGQRYVIDTSPGSPPIYTNYVAPNYFDVMGVSVVRGRSFHNGEAASAIIAESAARALWPNQDPIGKTWQFENSLRTIVGVVKDSGVNLLIDSHSVEAYLPIEPARVDSSVLMVHAKDLPLLIRAIPPLSAAMGQPVNVLSLATARESTLDGQRKAIMILVSLGFVASALAAAGMFAMVAFAVAQRTREIGIRIAIGARPRNVLQTLLDRNYAPAAIGMCVGTTLGLVLGKVAKSIVDTVEDPLDPIGFVTGLAVFLLIAAVATLTPAMKALRIDPASTLRCE